MQEWQVGAVRIRSVLEHAMPVPPEVFLPTATPEALTALAERLGPRYIDGEGHLLFAFQAFLVESQGQRILVDTCFGNDRELPFVEVLHTDFLERLTAAGFGPDDVDIVVCTHLHTDHVGWITHLVDGQWVLTFPRARHLFGQVEYDHWQTHEHFSIDLTDTVVPVVAAGLHELVAVDHVVTEEVALVATPGHTPGHVSVHIRSGGAEAFITGDLVHHPVQIHEPSWSSWPDDDAALAASTRQRVFEGLADSDVLVLGTHFSAPAGGHVEREAAGLIWRGVDAPAASG